MRIITKTKTLLKEHRFVHIAFRKLNITNHIDTFVTHKTRKGAKNSKTEPKKLCRKGRIKEDLIRI